MFAPAGRIIVAPIQPPQTTKSGLYIPTAATCDRGVVVAAVDRNSFRLNDLVVVSQPKVDTFMIGDKEFWSVRVEDVLANLGPVNADS